MSYKQKCYIDEKEMQALFAVCARMHYRGFDDAIFVCLDPFYFSFH